VASRDARVGRPIARGLLDRLLAQLRFEGHAAAEAELRLASSVDVSIAERGVDRDVFEVSADGAPALLRIVAVPGSLNVLRSLRRPILSVEMCAPSRREDLGR